MDRKYFDGLDVVRAFAAFLVIFHHIELTIVQEFGHVGEFGIFQNAVVYIVGKRGVHIFFMLSGFLITYLLIQEKLKRGRISIEKFYLRRILRIWPLYFLTVFIGFFLLPFLLEQFEFLNALHYYPDLIRGVDAGSNSSILYFLFFIPILALKYFPPVAGAAHLWSIGVEEQFYLFWPLIFFIKKIRYQLLLILGIALLPFLPHVLVRIPGGTQWADWIKYFPFFWMAMGGLGAFVFHYYQKPLSEIFNRFPRISWLITAVILTVGLIFKTNDYLFGVIGVLLILRFSIGHQWLPFQFPVLSFLGKISFGLYIYHPAVMFILISAFQYNFPNWQEVTYLKLCAYLSIVSFTIGIAWVSYKFFEKPFIELKDNKFKSL